MLLDDALALGGASDDFAMHLDLDLGLLERQRAGGPAGNPTEYLANAVALIRARADVGPWAFGGAARLGWVAGRLAEHGAIKPVNAGWIDDFVIASAEAYPGCSTSTSRRASSVARRPPYGRP